MIEVKIVCEASEWQAHLDALAGRGTKIALEGRNLRTSVVNASESGNTSSNPEPDREETVAPKTAQEPAAATELAKTVAPEENPARRRRRTAAEIAAANNTLAISTGEERVDPQDTADEQAEAAAAKMSSALTHNDVRKMVKTYADKFGVERAVKDVATIIGGQISDIPDDQEKLGEAITRITHALAGGASSPESTREPEPPQESLFGGDEAPKAPEPPRATQDDVMKIARDYATKYDPSAADWRKSSVLMTDSVALWRQAFEKPALASFKDVAALPGEQAVNFGRAAAVLDVALRDNPFKR